LDEKDRVKGGKRKVVLWEEEEGAFFRSSVLLYNQPDAFYTIGLRSGVWRGSRRKRKRTSEAQGASSW